MKQKILFVILLLLATVGTYSYANKTKHVLSVASKVTTSNELRIGYIIYPPLLTKDLKTGELSGISYDITEAAAKKLNLKTVWVEEVGWGSAIEGLKTKRYDMLGTQMWPNSARAREAVFSNAPMNSVIYPYIRSTETRFSNGITGLNSPEYTISTLDGEMAQFIAKEDYPQAKIVALPQLSSYSEVFLNITNAKADITFVEPSAANNYLKSNPGTIKRVGDTAIRTFGNSFAFARGENDMALMWNVALSELENDGTIEKILAKYNASEDYSLNK
jgi:ABC-type amino acid transport substrate-binding protein